MNVMLAKATSIRTWPGPGSGSGASSGSSTSGPPNCRNQMARMVPACPGAGGKRSRPRRPHARRLGPERGLVAGVDLGPPRLGRDGQGGAVEVGGQGVEAGVPAGAVPGRLADLVELVGERQDRAAGLVGQLEPQGLVA